MGGVHGRATLLPSRNSAGWRGLDQREGPETSQIRGSKAARFANHDGKFLLPLPTPNPANNPRSNEYPLGEYRRANFFARRRNANDPYLSRASALASAPRGGIPNGRAQQQRAATTQKTPEDQGAQELARNE